jgi:hypothetical protein
MSAVSAYKRSCGPASSDSLVVTRALCAISKAYEVLCRAGCKEFSAAAQPAADRAPQNCADRSEGTNATGLLSPTTSDEEAEEISQFLVDMACPSWTVERT